MDEVLEIAKRAKKCAPVIGSAKSSLKNRVLSDMAGRLVKYSSDIISANDEDIKKSRLSGISASLLDRLSLDKSRIEKIAASIDEVVELKDPIGEVIFGYDLPNGLTLKNVRVAIGVIGIIYEARPNVTVDASVLCLKAGSCVILRGSSHALLTNLKIVEILRRSLKENDFCPDIIQIIPNPGREDVQKLMQLRSYVDLLIPRGGTDLIESVVANSKVPVIETGVGNCHIYIDNKIDGMDLAKICEIIVNAKTQKPSVCNAAEKLLVHQDIAGKVLPVVLDSLKAKSVLIKGDERTMNIYPYALKAGEEDWYKEYLDLVIGVKVVDNINDAVDHINKYGSHHTEAIITSDYHNALYFTNACDSSTIFVNASTRFTDGGEFGMGAEIGISTQKLHWRGPMGLQQITTNKFIVFGEGQVRE